MANAIGFSSGKIVKIKSGEDLDVGAGDLKVDTIAESSTNAGVTIDGVLLKDNDIIIPDGSTIGSASAAAAITIANSGNVSLSNDLTVTGSLNVSGANNVISATNVQYEDTLLELGMEDDGSGGVQAPSTQTVKDIGLIFHVHDGNAADKDALFFDATNSQYYLHTGVTETNGVLSGGSAATLNATFAGNLTGDVTGDLTGNADSADQLSTARSIALSGDVTGSANFDGSANITIAATIAANSVALGTDTTGNYVATIADSGSSHITVANSGSESAAVTLSITAGAVDTAELADDAVTAAKLADTSVSAGSYGSSSAVPTFTVDAQGRLTAAGTAAISTSFDISADSGSNDTVAGGETLTISGTANQLATTVSDNEITIDFVDSPIIGGGSGQSVTIDGDFKVKEGFGILSQVTLSSGTVDQGKFVTVTLTEAANNNSMIIGMHFGDNSATVADLVVNGTIVEGFDQSGFTAGDQLFLATDGSITDTAPTSGEVIQVGYALNNASEGKMYVDIKHIMSN